MKTFEQFVNNKTKFKIGDKVFLYFKKYIYSGNIQFEKGTIRDITYNNNVPNSYYIKLTRFNNSFLSLFINQAEVDIYLDTPENLEKCIEKENMKLKEIEKNREKFKHIDPYGEDEWETNESNRKNKRVKIFEQYQEDMILGTVYRFGNSVIYKDPTDLKEKKGIIKDINLNHKGYEHNPYALIEFENGTRKWCSFLFITKKLGKQIFSEFDPYGEDDWLDEKLRINKYFFKKKISYEDYDDIEPGDRVTVEFNKEKISGTVLGVNKNYHCNNNHCIYIKFDDNLTKQWYHVCYVVNMEKGQRITNPLIDPYGEDNWYEDIDDTNESVNNDQIIKYTGRVWKNHIAEHFKKNKALIYTGVGKGGTVFLDYDKMINYLKNDGRKWYIAEIELDNDPLLFEFGNDWMATILVNKKTETGFYPLD